MPRKPSSGLPTRKQILDFIETSGQPAGKREISRAFGLHGHDKILLKALLKDMADEGLIDSAPGRAFHKAGGVPRAQAPGGVLDLWRMPVLRNLLLVNVAMAASWDAHSFTAPVVGHARDLSASAIGLVAGWLFHLFLGDERSPDRLFIAMAGAVVLTTGAANYVGMSALFPGVLTRIVGLMIHIDLAGIDRAISWTSFGIGLVAWVTLCAASAVAFAAVYNRAVPS